MSWQLLLAISVITQSISVLLQRLLLHKDKSDPIAYVIVFQGLVAIIGTAYVLVHGFHMPDLTKYWFPILATFVLYGLAHTMYAKTLQQVEASVVSIFLATNAIWVMLMSYLLFHERLSIEEVLGALLIFTSVGMLAERSGKLKLDRGILLGLLTGLLFGFATVAWVYVGKHADTPSWLALSFAGPSLVVLLTNPKAVMKMKPFLHGGTLMRMVLLAIIFSICNITLLTAYQYGKASLIAPLQQTSLIVTIVLAIIFLRERTRLWQKAIAATVCFLGVLLVAMR